MHKEPNKYTCIDKWSLNLIVYTDQSIVIGIYLQSTKLQVFIDEYLILADDLVTIARGKTPPSVAALAQLKKRCKLVWVAVTNDVVRCVT